MSRKIIIIVLCVGALVGWVHILLSAGSQIEAGGDNPPVAHFLYTVNNPDGGGSVSFRDDSTDPDLDITSYLWEFGDGEWSTEKDPVHTYARGGTYTVTLTVTDNGGRSSSYSENVTLRDSTGPRARFVYSPATPRAGEDIQFTDTSSDPDGTIVGWLWDFGDNTKSTERNPVHRYSTSGYVPVGFKVTLTVRDDSGLTDTYQTVVEVAPSR